MTWFNSRTYDAIPANEKEIKVFIFLFICSHCSLPVNGFYCDWCLYILAVSHSFLIWAGDGNEIPSLIVFAMAHLVRSPSKCAAGKPGQPSASLNTLFNALWGEAHSERCLFYHKSSREPQQLTANLCLSPGECVIWCSLNKKKQEPVN